MYGKHKAQAPHNTHSYNYSPILTIHEPRNEGNPVWYLYVQCADYSIDIDSIFSYGDA